MATKRLARTVVEGGRSNTYERRQSNYIVRAKSKQYLARVRQDPEYAEYYAPAKREPVSRRYGFTDKLGPVYAWMDKQVGRPWSKIYSEICAKYDKRSLAGQHIVDTHIVGEVQGAGGEEYSPGAFSFHYYSYYIDDQGLLQKTERPASQMYKPDWVIENTQWGKASAMAWAKGRRIIEIHRDGDVAIHWANVREKEKVFCCTTRDVRDLGRRYGFHCALGTHIGDHTFEEDRKPGVVDYHWYHEAPSKVERGGVLNKKELHYWNRLDEGLKNLLRWKV